MTQKTLFSPNLTVEEAEELIKNGADVDKKDDLGCTPLFYIDNIKIAQLLITHGADVNQADITGWTPLHFNKNIDIIKLLIENGTDVNRVNDLYNTPLHLAKNLEIVELLIEKGAYLYAKNNYNQTIIHLSDNIDIIKFLINKNFNVNAVCNDGCTVLDNLRADCHEIIQFIIEHGGLCGKIENYLLIKDYFNSKQQEVFDAFVSITNNDDDFFQMCLVYQNDQKNKVKIEMTDIDIIN